jgi:hypothetical protein
MNLFAFIISTPDIFLGIVLVAAAVIILLATSFGRRLRKNFRDGYEGRK